MSTAANPKAPKPSGEEQEPVGQIASDSLAAESIKEGGAFAENDNAAISSVKGANSTLNNTDTSGATVLQPAADGTERVREEAKGLGSDEKGTTGVKYPDAEQAQFDGVHSSEGYVGGPSKTTSSSATTTDVAGQFSGATGDSFADGATASTSDSSSAGVSSGSSAAKKATSSATTGTSSSSSTGIGSSDSTAKDAPNYAATVSGALRSDGEDKPKGENLQEGGIPQTKTFTGAVGGPNDPGRLAEQEFTKVGSGSTIAAGEIQRGASESGGPQITGGQYDVLESERA